MAKPETSAEEEARQQLAGIAHLAPLSLVKRLLDIAGTVAQDSVDPKELVPVRILRPSGATVFEARVPPRTTIWALLQRLAADFASTASTDERVAPGRLSLLHGDTVVPRQAEIGSLSLTEEDSLMLVTAPGRNFVQVSHHPGETMDHMLKCCVYGSAAAGKTALVDAMTGHEFTDTYMPTIGIDFKVCSMMMASVGAEPGNGSKLKVQFWDTAGQERFRSITRGYIQGASGYMFVFSLSHPETLTALKQFVDLCAENVGAFQCKVLVGTHADLPRQISEEEVARFQEQNCPDCRYVEVSSKTGLRVDEVLFAFLEAYCDNAQL